jgi:MOSC domain-containing protein YiiM
MKIVSINISPPKIITYKGKLIQTGIFKKPVRGPVFASTHNLTGDGQADLKNHGGPDKAVYAYSDDHYQYWSKVLNREDFEYGQFGENLTVTGLDESLLCIGDQLQAGSVEFVITQPRVPCFKLGVRFADAQMPKKFLKSALTGCYLRVLQEGYLQAGDTINIVKHHKIRISLKDLFTAFYHKKTENAEIILAEALKVSDLSAAWKNQIEKRLSGKDQYDTILSNQ